jgi:predicted transposase YbfD/YdcC
MSDGYVMEEIDDMSCYLSKVQITEN